MTKKSFLADMTFMSVFLCTNARLIEKEKWDLNSEEGAQSSIVTKKIVMQG